MVVNIAQAAINLSELGLHLTDNEFNTMSNCAQMSSMTWVGRVDGELACIWGLIPPTLLSQQAYLWLYTTKIVEKHQFLFVRHSQRRMEEMLDEYPLIVGNCDANEKRSVRWLKWLGAEFVAKEGRRLAFQIRKNCG